MFFVPVVNQKMMFFQADLSLCILTEQINSHELSILTVVISRNMPLWKKNNNI